MKYREFVDASGLRWSWAGACQCIRTGEAHDREGFVHLSRVGLQAGHLGRAVAAKCPKCYHFMAKIEKIHGVSVAIVTVSPWISNK
jgi:hypothetical protein